VPDGLWVEGIEFSELDPPTEVLTWTREVEKMLED